VVFGTGDKSAGAGDTPLQRRGAGDGERGHTTLQSRHPTPFCRSIPFNRHIPYNRYLPFNRCTTHVRSRGHTTAFVSREDAKTRRETQWSSARGTNRPELGTHHLSDGDGRSGGHTTSATGSGDTPHFNRGIPHHSVGACRSTGIYRSTGIRPNRGHTTAFVSREDAKTRRETQWSSAPGTNQPEMGTHHSATGPEMGTHHSATGTTPAASTPRNDGRSGGHTTSATGTAGAVDTPHSNRGIPHHTAETYHSTGTYPTTAAQHPGAGRNHLMITTSQLPASDCQLPTASFRLPASDCQLPLVCSSAPKAGHCSLRHGFHPILEHTG
jgi:hypothetical protein